MIDAVCLNSPYYLLNTPVRFRFGTRKGRDQLISLSLSPCTRTKHQREIDREVRGTWMMGSMMMRRGKMVPKPNPNGPHLHAYAPILILLSLPCPPPARCPR